MVGLDFQVAGFADFNQDGTTDMMLRNRNTGSFEIYGVKNNVVRPKRQSSRRRFRSRSDQSSIRCGRLGAAIPLPKRVSPPVTEVGSSGLTPLLISRKNELGLSGSPRGGPSEGWADDERDQPDSSDKCLHNTSPCLDHRPRFVH
jgi:hypothetical protein